MFQVVDSIVNFSVKSSLAFVLQNFSFIVSYKKKVRLKYTVALCDLCSVFLNYVPQMTRASGHQFEPERSDERRSGNSVKC
jgi:imidazoleglycerol phosphate synthase glutamine amidotransferase subunit HisH